MNRNSPVPLWAVLSVGAVLLAGVYVFAQRTIAPLQASVIVNRPTMSPQPIVSATTVPSVAVEAPSSTASLSAASPTTTTTGPLIPTVTRPEASTSIIDSSEIDLAVGNNATFLVEDSAGHHTGKNFPSNDVLQEIPHSTYFEDRIGNAETGQAGTLVSHQAQILQPLEGTYVVTLTGLQPGSYDLVIRAFSIDGSSQPPLEAKGSITRQGQITFQLVFSSALGRISTLTKSPQ
jgi:hypothetical protein